MNIVNLDDFLKHRLDGRYSIISKETIDDCVKWMSLSSKIDFNHSMKFCGCDVVLCDELPKDLVLTITLPVENKYRLYKL